MLSGAAIDTIAKSGTNSRKHAICAIWVVTRLKIVPMSSADIGTFFICLPNRVSKNYKSKELERHEHH
jgi:1,2-phenylacetyl-CoA epoxidase PaaB subunit